jgi:hypothetical protein
MTLDTKNSNEINARVESQTLPLLAISLRKCGGCCSEKRFKINRLRIRTKFPQCGGLETNGPREKSTAVKDDAMTNWCERICVATKRVWKYVRVNQLAFEVRRPTTLSDFLEDHKRREGTDRPTPEGSYFEASPTHAKAALGSTFVGIPLCHGQQSRVTTPHGCHADGTALHLIMPVRV